MNKLLLATIAACLAVSSFAVAAEPAAKFDFSDGILPKGWRAAKGTWKVTDGKLSGAELASDEHAAVLTYPAKHTNASVQISFQLNGSKGFNLSFNHPKGHLYRVVVSANELRINLDKDKKDPKSKAVVLNRVKQKFEQGKIYTLSCKTQGDTVTASVGDSEIKGTHEKLKLPKTGYRLVVKGKGVLFDDLTVLSAE